MPYTPEPNLTPPEPYYVMADCQHEVYEYEYLFSFEGKTYCEDCIEEKFKEMTVYDMADITGTGYALIEKP